MRKKVFISVGVKIFILVIFLIALVLAGFAVTSTIIMQSAMESEMNQSGTQLAVTISESLTKQKERGLSIVFDKFVTSDAVQDGQWKFMCQTARTGWLSQFKSIMEADKQGTILNILVSNDVAQTFLSERDYVPLVAIQGFTFTPEERVASDKSTSVTIEEGTYVGALGSQVRVRKFSRPILSETGSYYGMIDVFVSLRKIEDLRTSILWKVGIVGVIALVAGIGATFFLSRSLTKPIGSLVRDMRVAEAGDLTHKSAVSTNDEIAIIAQAFNKMIDGLRESEKMRQQSKLVEHDLELAHNIQMRMIPTKLPELRNARFAAHYKPAKSVGGDYYDIIVVDDFRFFVFLGDVSGKGMPAALIMSMTKGLIELATKFDYSPVKILSKVNEVLHHEIPRGHFVTTCGIFVDLEKKIVRVSNAGHMSPVFQGSSGKVEMLKADGIALGVAKPKSFEAISREREYPFTFPGRIVMYSDGVSEAMNAQREQFEDERIYKIVENCSELGTQGIADKLLNEVLKHASGVEQYDDITLIVIDLFETK